MASKTLEKVKKAVQRGRKKPPPYKGAYSERRRQLAKKKEEKPTPKATPTPGLRPTPRIAPIPEPAPRPAPTPTPRPYIQPRPVPEPRSWGWESLSPEEQREAMGRGPTPPARIPRTPGPPDPNQEVPPYGWRQYEDGSWGPAPKPTPFIDPSYPYVPKFGWFDGYYEPAWPPPWYWESFSPWNRPYDRPYSGTPYWPPEYTPWYEPQAPQRHVEPYESSYAPPQTWWG